MPYNNVLNELIIPNIKEIGNDFLEQNTSLKETDFSNLIQVGNDFLHYTKMTSISLPNLEKCGHNFYRLI